MCTGHGQPQCSVVDQCILHHGLLLEAHCSLAWAVASFPDLPGFLILQLAFSIIHGNKERWKWRKTSEHLSCEWHQVDMGEGPHLNNVINFIIYTALCHKARPYMFTRSRALHLTSKKLALRFTAPVLVIGHHSPYVHLASTWRHSHCRCSQAFPVFFCALLLPCIISKKKKNRGGLETRLCAMAQSSMDFMCFFLLY